MRLKNTLKTLDVQVYPELAFNIDRETRLLTLYLFAATITIYIAHFRQCTIRSQALMHMFLYVFLDIMSR